jgi:hypothetical protein
MHLASIFIASIIAAALVAWLAFRRHAIATCHEVMFQLRPFMLRGRYYLLDEITEDVDVWAATMGIKGLWYRWRNRVPLVRLCQLRTINPEASVKEQRATEQEFRLILETASRLTTQSFLAILFYPLRRLAPAIWRGHTLAAFRVYADLAISTRSYYDLDDNAVCAIQLATLL